MYTIVNRVITSWHRLSIHQDLGRIDYLYSKAKILSFIYLVLLLLSLGFVFLKMALFPEFKLPAMVPLAAIAIQIFIFKHFPNLTLSGNLLIASLFLLFAPLAFKYGGIYSIVLLWLGVAPYVAFILVFRYSGLVWLVVVEVFAFYLFHLEMSSTISYKHQMGDAGPSFFYWNYALLFLVNTLIFFAYARDKGRIVTQLREKEKLLIHQKDELTEQDEARSINEMELRQLNENLEHFAYTVSHDLKEPLRMIKMYTQLLKRNLGSKLSPTNEEFMDYVLNGTDRMHRLLDDLLQYSRLNNYEDGIKKVDLNDILLIVKNNLAFSIQNKNADIIPAHMLPTVIGNPTFVTQLFQNLLSNAIKFHHPDRQPIITISSKEYPDEYVINIEDNGIGIPQEYQDKIFDIFTKLHNRLEYDGSGIGLATCKKIVAAMGGTIRLESIQNEGTTFSITIPKEPNKQKSNEKKLLAQMYN